MNKWSLKYTKKITEDLAYFLIKRVPTVVKIQVSNLYNAIVEINSISDIEDRKIGVVKTESGWYLMVNCDKEERFELLFNKITAMYNHHLEIITTLNNIRQLE